MPRPPPPQPLELRNLILCQDPAILIRENALEVKFWLVFSGDQKEAMPSCVYRRRYAVRLQTRPPDPCANWHRWPIPLKPFMPRNSRDRWGPRSPLDIVPYYLSHLEVHRAMTKSHLVGFNRPRSGEDAINMMAWGRPLAPWLGAMVHISLPPATKCCTPYNVPLWPADLVQGEQRWVSTPCCSWEKHVCKSLIASYANTWIPE